VRATNSRSSRLILILETRSFCQIGCFPDELTSFPGVGRIIDIFLEPDRLFPIKDEKQFNGFCHGLNTFKKNQRLSETSPAGTGRTHSFFRCASLITASIFREISTV